jgi:hypothetical protein
MISTSRHSYPSCWFPQSSGRWPGWQYGPGIDGLLPLSNIASRLQKCVCKRQSGICSGLQLCFCVRLLWSGHCAMSGGWGSCRSFTLKIESAANPPGLQYQSPGTSRRFSGSKRRVQRGVGWGGVSNGSGIISIFWHVIAGRILLGCQNDVPITPKRCSILKVVRSRSLEQKEN